MFGDGDYIGSRNLCDSNTAIGLVCSIEIDVIGSDTGSDGELEVLGFGEAFGSEVARVEASMSQNKKSEILDLTFTTYGVVMMTSASTSSLSNVLFSPSLSLVVTSVWPFSSSHFRMPSSFSVVPKSSGTCLACSWPS